MEKSHSVDNCIEFTVNSKKRGTTLLLYIKNKRHSVHKEEISIGLKLFNWNIYSPLIVLGFFQMNVN